MIINFLQQVNKKTEINQNKFYPIKNYKIKTKTKRFSKIFLSKMLRKLSNSFIINKNLLRKVGTCFSSNPQPNKNNQQPDIDPPTNEQQKTPKDDTKNIRSEARIFVCRSQLYKYAKAEVDYEKLNAPTKQLQKLQKALQYFGIKVRHVVDDAPLIEFHRAQQVSKKSEKKKDKDDKQHQGSQQAMPAQQDLKLEFKIYTRPFVQLSSPDYKEFEKYFSSPKDYFGLNKQQQKDEKVSNLFNASQKRSGSLGNSSLKDYPNAFNALEDFVKSGVQKLTDPQNLPKKKWDYEKFKEFNLYLRNVRNQGSKWLKFELMVEEWQNVHFYRISVVDNAQQDAKKRDHQPNKYIGPQAKELDKELLEFLKLSFDSVQEIDPLLFLPIYYYTGMKEQECYKKWLQDLVELTK